ncbi:hypothetical protein [Providencia huaxiensis]|uniref:hypothetical protein n=1 Tax=Providencia huaxiensis TaxID=2027290 RepID=UPI001EFE235A|nr:hypothetical protein [Providencia huaxiensis]MCG9536565.1 hypothetical protein [Providencia huaxiensis]
MARKIKKRKTPRKNTSTIGTNKKHYFLESEEPQGIMGTLPTLVEHGLTIFYIVFLLSLWFSPQWSGVAVIYNMVLILLFEFILIHMSTMMAVVAKGFFFIVIAAILGGVAYIFHTTQINSSAILYIYAATLINRIIIGRKQANDMNSHFNAFDEGIAKLRHYVACFIIIMLLGRYLPQGGLTEQYLEQNNYYGMLKMTGATENPLMVIQFGVLYYSTSLLWVLWRYLNPDKK